MKIKPKLNKWNLIKLKSFCIAKGTHTVWKDNLQNGTKCLKKYNSQVVRVCVCVCVCVHMHTCTYLLSCVWLFATPWTVAHQAPPSMGFSRQEYWSGLPLPPPEDLPNPGIKPMSPVSPALAGGFFTTEPPGKTVYIYGLHIPLRFKLSIWFMNMLLAENIIDA